MASKILLIGGHGKVALLAIPLLAADGHTVDAVIRNPDHAADVASAGANPVVLDVERLSVAELTSLAEGHDAVVWSAGAGGGNPGRTYSVDRDAAIRSIDAAVAAGVPRYVMVSYFGAGPDHGVSPEVSFFHYAEAKASADEYLRSSTLDWTILAPSTLTLEAPSGRISVDDESSGHVSRANVAEVIRHVLSGPLAVRRTIRFNDGDAPVAQAIAD